MDFECRTFLVFKKSVIIIIIIIISVFNRVCLFVFVFAKLGKM